jgi:photosystem II stability/assembly factor-like uncharacterized protein
MTGWRVTEVLDIAVDPFTPSTLYLGTAYGIWRSPDAGAIWFESNSGIGAPRETFIQVIVPDRHLPGTILAGGEAGIFRSSDGGATWMHSEAAIPVRTLVQSTTTPDEWLAGTQGQGALISRDAGHTWRAVEDLTERTLWAVAINPHNPEGMAAAGYRTPPVVSFDGGRTWNQAATGLEHLHSHALAYDLAVGGRLWAGTVGGGIFRLDPGEGIWTQSGMEGASIWDILPSSGGQE